MQRPSTRRTFLLSTAATGVAATAGCLATGTSDEDESTPTGTPERTPPEDLDAWLEDANGYDGDTRRFGPSERPTVAVGEETDDGIAFSPVVIEVPPMTEVEWDWTGHGGQHNVVALDGTFDSGNTNAQAGTSYEFFFKEPGEYAFVSEPDDGMRGAVVVAEPPSTGYDAVDEWLADVSNFDGTVTDRTGSATATVRVGTEGNGGTFAFDPPALRVTTGSTVQWEWTGEGGGHNVTFEDADIGSGGATPEPDTAFEHTFEEAGQYRYSCLPHQGVGMKGAVIVE
ncbi:halocyanin domain-containing protein [Haloarcula sediminis]|uniref:halocyanin domain-containing protein n=1 Tax=Haloarcula sediminis TaxID=3111777 RepID=UPI002D78D3A5|nr:halocyanin domain-containing protein [Haloarcula sp. CK38]